MADNNKKLILAKVFGYSGISLLLLSVALLVYMYLLEVLYEIEIITMDRISAISIPASLGIALFAIGLSIKSDERMVAVADSVFLEVIGIFEDKRLNLKTKRTQLMKIGKDKYKKNTVCYEMLSIEFFDELSFSIWKCYTYLQRAKVLKNWLSTPYESKIIHYSTEYFAELLMGRNFRNMIITSEYKEHIKWMYDFVSSLNGYKNHKDGVILDGYYEDLHKN